VTWTTDTGRLLAEWASARRALVDLLVPVADDLEILGADPLRLFNRLRRPPGFLVSARG
jgi:hypothetical protein